MHRFIGIGRRKTSATFQQIILDSMVAGARKFFNFKTKYLIS